MVPAKFLFERARRPTRAHDGVVTAFRDGEVTLRSNRRTEGFTNAVEEYGYQGVRHGDLVIHSMDGFAGAIGVSDSDGKASPVVHCYTAGPGVEPRFYAYLLRHLARSDFITSLAKGIRERSTAFDPDAFRALLLPAPPPNEQQAIADFLDTETARIDALITKKTRLRDLVIERFRADVSRIVASGPAIKVRRVIRLRTSGPRGWADRVGDTGAPFIRSQNLRRAGIELDLTAAARVNPPETPEALRSRTSVGDVLIGITGANTGWVGIVRDRAAGGYVSQHVAVLRPRDLVPEWLAYSLFAHQAQDQLLGGQYGGTKTQLALDDLAELKICVPSHAEQLAGIQRIKAAVTTTRRIEQALSQQIALLQEHRQALITASVTGELGIPRVAA